MEYEVLLKVIEMEKSRILFRFPFDRSFPSTALPTKVQRCMLKRTNVEEKKCNHIIHVPSAKLNRMNQ